MSRSSYALPFLALAVCLVFAGEAQAQESTTRGFTLGVHAFGSIAFDRECTRSRCWRWRDSVGIRVESEFHPLRAV